MSDLALPQQPQSQPQPQPQPRPFIWWWLLVALALAAAAALTWYLWGPSSAMVEPDFTEPRLMLGDQVLPGKVLQDKGDYLASVAVVREHLDPNIFWDAAEETVTVTTRDRVLRMQTEQLSAHINAQPVEIQLPATLDQGEPFIPLGILAELYGLNVNFQAATNSVILEKAGQPHLTALVQQADTPLRQGPSRRQPILARLAPGNSVAVWSEEQPGWLRVRTSDGSLGYVEEQDVQLGDLITPPLPTAPPPPPWKPLGESISLVWEQVVKRTPDMSVVGKLSGINVVSPTWFHLADQEGRLENLADPAYVRWAHENGYQVWALITNQFDPELTHAMLQSSEKRQKVIDQLLVFAQLYKLDGINLDFENLKAKDRSLYTQFVRELTPFLHEQDLTVSVDVTIPSTSAWSAGYDRRSLAAVVDYVMVMTYDEHWSSSPRAGSVASLPWVKTGLEAMLKEVPSKKLLLGIPLYTRLWEEKREGLKLTVSSRTLTMPAAEKLLQEKAAQLQWDAQSGQNYYEYREDGATYRVWLEDQTSLTARLKMARTYQLAGVAFWRRGFETTPTWSLVEESLTRRPFPGPQQ